MKLTRNHVGIIGLALATVSLTVCISVLYTQNIYLHSRMKNAENQLQTGKLYLTDLTWEYSESSPSYYAVGVRAVIFNSGTSTANPTESLHIEIYDDAENLQESKDVHIGSILGESSKILMEAIHYSGEPPQIINATIS